MLILSADEIRKVEERCFENYYGEAELMLKAGTACYEEIVKRYGEKLKNASVRVFCGNGKNAGDGFVIAKLLYCCGADSRIVLCDKEPVISQPLMYYNQALKSGVRAEYFTEDSTNCDFIVDCMFGIGFHGEPRNPFDKVFEAVCKSRAKIISVDIPSGIDSSTGAVCKNCIRADFTIAISTLKYGHILPPSNDYCGETVVADIGIPKDCYGNEYAKTIEFEDVKACFKRRNKNSNKGTFGRQLNICGSYKMFGAAVIAAQSALRSGAGLVKLMLPKSVYPLAASHLIQPIFEPAEETEEGTFSYRAIKETDKQLKWANSIVFGCGIGVNNDTRALTEYVLRNAKSPVILDADGINCINSSISIFKEIKVPVVLTPHPGEMSGLTSKTIAEIQEERIKTAKAFARENKVILVLKGANTVVTDGEKVFVNVTGNPSMAMGGTGDMLSGMIGAFVSQGMAPLDAAKSAVYIHGLCADRASKELSLRGILVSDMIEQLGALMSEFE